MTWSWKNQDTIWAPTLYPDTDKRVRSSACLPVNAMVAIYYYNFLIRGVFCTPASESKKNNNKWPASVGVWVQNTSQINAIGAIVKPQCARWCAMCDVLAESWCAVRPVVDLAKQLVEERLVQARVPEVLPVPLPHVHRRRVHLQHSNPVGNQIPETQS